MLVESLCVSAPSHAAPITIVRDTRGFLAETGWLGLLQGWGWKLGPWNGRVRSGEMSEGWVLVEDAEVIEGGCAPQKGIGNEEMRGT